MTDRNITITVGSNADRALMSCAKMIADDLARNNHYREVIGCAPVAEEVEDNHISDDTREYIARDLLGITPVSEYILWGLFAGDGINFLRGDIDGIDWDAITDCLIYDLSDEDKMAVRHVVNTYYQV